MDAQTTVKDTAEGKHKQTNQGSVKLIMDQTVFSTGVKIEPEENLPNLISKL